MDEKIKVEFFVEESKMTIEYELTKEGLNLLQMADTVNAMKQEYVIDRVIFLLEDERIRVVLKNI